ncbi:hypothetical protein M440DRAFT_1401105 [Trichoderma longibrachiatum ATCC 18648]|uniref:Uncharacterized protein n=1 Tax=Trichoderma longibrachiatum ATCC 18648 TaxID=983965 RepID=A0A2T4C5C8_TRILO|nr:hypothetical protein M440DRAFT_1401105 [Trichoderma longibrachiatum ATCC 18648]
MSQVQPALITLLGIFLSGQGLGDGGHYFIVLPSHWMLGGAPHASHRHWSRPPG